MLDWELCTLGDPLADVGYLGVYWFDGNPHDGTRQRPDPGRRVSRRTPISSSATPLAPGATVGGIDYYVAFGCWRLAVISEGVYARYLHGAMGDQATSTSPRSRRAPSRWPSERCSVSRRVSNDELLLDGWARGDVHRRWMHPRTSTAAARVPV